MVRSISFSHLGFWFSFHSFKFYWCRRPPTHHLLLLLCRYIHRWRQRDHIRTLRHPRPCSKRSPWRLPRQNHRAHLDRPRPCLSFSSPPNAIHARAAVRFYPIGYQCILHTGAYGQAPSVLFGGKHKSVCRVGALAIAIFSITSTVSTRLCPTSTSPTLHLLPLR
jgi:hypothetical protein